MNLKKSTLQPSHFLFLNLNKTIYTISTISKALQYVRFIEDGKLFYLPLVDILQTISKSKLTDFEYKTIHNQVTYDLLHDEVNRYEFKDIIFEISISWIESLPQKITDYSNYIYLFIKQQVNFETLIVLFDYNNYFIIFAILLKSFILQTYSKLIDYMIAANVFGIMLYKKVNKVDNVVNTYKFLQFITPYFNYSKTTLINVLNQQMDKYSSFITDDLDELKLYIDDPEANSLKQKIFDVINHNEISTFKIIKKMAQFLTTKENTEDLSLKLSVDADITLTYFLCKRLYGNKNLTDEEIKIVEDAYTEYCSRHGVPTKEQKLNFTIFRNYLPEKK